MSRMAHDGSGLKADASGVVETGEQIQTQVPEQSEQLRRTRHWRLDQLTGLGFDSTDAASMADDAQVDLGLARRLIALGCPLDTAARILL